MGEEERGAVRLGGQHRFGVDLAPLPVLGVVVDLEATEAAGHVGGVAVERDAVRQERGLEVSERLLRHPPGEVGGPPLVLAERDGPIEIPERLGGLARVRQGLAAPPVPARLRGLHRDEPGEVGDRRLQALQPEPADAAPGERVGLVGRQRQARLVVGERELVLSGDEVHEAAQVVALGVGELLLGGLRVGARGAAGVALGGERRRHAQVGFGRGPIELRGAAEVGEGALAVALRLVELRAVEVAARLGRRSLDEAIQLRQRGLVLATLAEEVRAHEVGFEVGGIRGDERGPRA